MLIELLFLLLIIIVVLLSLLFLKSWHVHIIFKSDDLNHDSIIQINFLIFQFLIRLTEKPILLEIQLNILSKNLILKEILFNEDSSKEEVNEETTNDDEDDKDINNKLIQLYPLLKDAQYELMHIIKLITKMVTFNESYAIINLGLSDNNLTIKICTLFWSLTAPLYPLGLKLILTPEINKIKFKSDINVKFDIKLFNLLKIAYTILKSKKLRNLIKFLIN